MKTKNEEMIYDIGNLRIYPSMIAEICGVSYPTIKKWINDRVIPEPVTGCAKAHWLAKDLNMILKRIANREK